MIRKKYLPGYIRDINVIGVGGTGSYFAQGLAKLVSGYQLDVRVTLMDPDVIEERNCARQNFWHYEIGHNKAEALSTRLNQQYGLQFAYSDKPGEESISGYGGSRLIITCVDSIEARRAYKDQGMWLDMGNGETTGQAIFGNTNNPDNIKSVISDWKHLPTVDWLPNPYMVAGMETLKDKPQEVACADHPFTEQGVYANEWAAQAGLAILHQLLIKEQVATPRIYFDTSTSRMNPVYITKEIFK